MTRMYRRPGALAVLVAAAALALAACSGGSSSPQVASLGTSSEPGDQHEPGGPAAAPAAGAPRPRSRRAT